MKLAKAIEILQDLERGHYNNEPADQTNALKLGVEALKREKINRNNSDYVFVGLLPGETKE